MTGEPEVKVEAFMLAVAFPNEHQVAAKRAAAKAIATLDRRYWMGRFVAEVEGERVLIPCRLHFAFFGLPLPKNDHAWLYLCALKTRSTDGFERQRALGNLLQQPMPWAAPFVIKLIGEYVVEILDDIVAAMTPELEQILASFIVHDQSFWNTTKHRVTSYWNAYYRARWLPSLDRAERRDEYVGFRLIQQLEAAALRGIPT